MDLVVQQHVIGQHDAQRQAGLEGHRLIRQCFAYPQTCSREQGRHFLIQPAELLRIVTETVTMVPNRATPAPIVSSCADFSAAFCRCAARTETRC